MISLVRTEQRMEAYSQCKGIGKIVRIVEFMIIQSFDIVSYIWQILVLLQNHGKFYFFWFNFRGEIYLWWAAL